MSENLREKCAAPDDKQKVHEKHKKSTTIAEKAVREYNKQAKTSKCIEKTFRRCGQHIWDEDLSAFQEHLGG